MMVSVDFDGTIVTEDRAYDDLSSPFVLRKGVRDGLLALKRAGHVLILSSARANLALRKDWRLNPGWASGVLPFNVDIWKANQNLHECRYQQMLKFVELELPMIDLIDDGRQGKLLADLFIDDRAVASVIGVNWNTIALLYGEQEDNGAQI